MPSTFAIVISIAVASAQEQPPSPTVEQDDYVLLSVSTPISKCNLSIAENVDLLRLTRQPERWAGKCVAVKGYWRGRALFADPDDGRRRDSQSGDGLRKRRVGIYGTEQVLSSAPAISAIYTAVGVAGNCDTLGQGAIMVMGYCHYTSGPYIAVAEMRRSRP